MTCGKRCFTLLLCLCTGAIDAGAPTAASADSESEVSFPAFPLGSRSHTLALALTAYLTAMLKTCDTERQLIYFSDVWDEEDACVVAFNQDLLFQARAAD